ncbi:hypothetical protein ACFL0O_00360 [Thermodesulfobacteriota bacterium]
MQKILLVEPFYKSKYPPLGLMKISTYHKRAGDSVAFVKGIKTNIPLKDFDKVYITSLYTYEADKVTREINFYKDKCTNAEIVVGGIYASLMPEKVQADTGIKPHIGLWQDVEFLPPDYSLIPNHPWGDWSFVFTTRGCPNQCGFCAVKTLEPNPIINPSWKDHISKRSKKIMIHDNNITTANFEHFKKVMLYLSYLNKPVLFDNGFDCRRFNKNHCRYLKKINIRQVRFAFDSMHQDGYLQQSLEICIKMGIPASKILVYVLFNYHDTFEDALYRIKEIAKFGATPYAMEYVPLDADELSSSHYFGDWNRKLCKDFAYFINAAKLSNVMSFKQWKTKSRNKCI